MRDIVLNPAEAKRLRVRACWLALLCLLALCAWARPAQAAPSIDTCTAYITSLPTTISVGAMEGHAGGTWCLKNNLTVTFPTTPSTVQAIEVTAGQDMTLDCNGFTIQQISPNSGQTTYGIYGHALNTIAVRNCGIKGFSDGIYMNLPSGRSYPVGLLLEGNRTNGNGVGINIFDSPGWGVIVRHNQVLNSTSAGIVVNGSADVVDNTVAGVTAPAGSGLGVSGISVTAATGARVEHNQVSGLAGDGSGTVYGVYGSGSTHLMARRNTLVGNGSSGSTGFYCGSGSGRAMDNVLVGFATAFDTCGDAGGNDISP